MKFRMVNKIGLFLLCCFLTSFQGYGQERKAVPPFVNFVNDFADVLTPQEEAALNSKIKAIKDSSHAEIAIVTEASLDGRDVFDRSMDFIREYKVGDGQLNSGVLIYLAVNDRKIFIQTADKTQGALTDYTTKLIIDRSITPEFKAGNYYQGLDNGVTSIFQVLNGEFKAPAKKNKTGQSIFILLIIIVVVITILSRFGGGGNGGYNSRGGYILPNIWLGGGGFGGGGGGSSGGGFGGFGGGGGFNGGGAGGSW